METWQEARGKRAIFIGSSVCVGTGATADYGWSSHMADRMRRNGWRTHNCAIGGQRTADILARLHRDVLLHRPAVCIVGLGLANEGLPNADQPQAPYAVFLANLKDIAERLEAAGIFPMLGGVYPNDRYTPAQAETLYRARAEMARWPYPVLDWLDAVDDGQGHFQAGLAHDPYHPNDEGYARMAAAIPPTIWTLLDCPLP